MLTVSYGHEHTSPETLTAHVTIKGNAIHEFLTRILFSNLVSQEAIAKVVWVRGT